MNDDKIHDSSALEVEWADEEVKPELLILTPKQARHFWPKVSKAPHPKGCWEWQAARLEWGYGQFGYQGRMHPAHRISYRMHKGSIPDGLDVCHSCDNPPCVNPAHLWLGDDKANAEDRQSKNRGASPKGVANVKAKLSDEQVIEMRRLHREENFSHKKLATLFNVSLSTVYRILSGKLWTHLS